jgi:FeS assembly SUF system protein
MRDEIVKILRTVFDPEIPVNIYDLGLVYAIDISEAGAVNVRMTLTSPNCPVAESLPRQVKSRIESIPGVASANVDIVWEPPWSFERMSEAARLELECMGVDPTRLHGSRTTSLTVGRSSKQDRRSE